jgi:hypothetical protein
MIAKEPRRREARTSIGKGTPVQRPESSRTSALDDFSNLNLPESVNRGVASSLYKGAPESLRSVAKQTQARVSGMRESDSRFRSLAVLRG